MNNEKKLKNIIIYILIIYNNILLITPENIIFEIGIKLHFKQKVENKE